MKCILKYTIYLLIIVFIFLIFNKNLVEGLDDGAFPFLARIIGKNSDEILDYKTDYIGCHNYECDNKLITKEDTSEEIIEDFFDRTYLLSREIGDRDNIVNLLSIASNRDSDNLDERNAAYDKLKELYVNMINTRKYVKRKNIQSDVCNNHMDYSPAANIVGDYASYLSQQYQDHYGIPDGRCNHNLCCFDTKCSSKDNYDIHSAAAPSGSDNICGRGYTLKKDAHCFTYDDCNNPDKFKEYCCESNNTDEIDDIFDTINTGTENTKVLFWNSSYQGWVIGDIGEEIEGDGRFAIAYGTREQEDPATGPRSDSWMIKNPDGGDNIPDDSIRVTISGRQSPYENEFSPETEVYYVGGSRNHPSIDGLYYKQEEAINGYSYYIKQDEDNTITWDELSEWYNNISQNNEDINTQKLDKFLSITDGESVELSRMDFKDLLNE